MNEINVSNLKKAMERKAKMTKKTALNMCKCFLLEPKPAMFVSGVEKPKFDTSSAMVDKITQIKGDKIYIGTHSVPMKKKLIASGSFGKVFQLTFEYKQKKYCLALKMPRLADEDLTEVEYLNAPESDSNVGVIHMKAIKHDQCTCVIMPMASGDLSKLYELLDSEALDQICHQMLYTLHNLLSKGIYYFDLKARNILFFVTEDNDNTIYIKLADIGSVVPLDEVFPATHTHKDLNQKGFVSIPTFCDIYTVWFVYLYQVCLLYCRLLLGHENAVLPVHDTNKHSLEILKTLCSKTRAHPPCCSKVRRCCQKREKYVSFLEAICDDMRKHTCKVNHRNRVYGFFDMFHQDLQH